MRAGIWGRRKEWGYWECLWPCVVWWPYHMTLLGMTSLWNMKFGASVRLEGVVLPEDTLPSFFSLPVSSADPLSFNELMVSAQSRGYKQARPLWLSCSLYDERSRFGSYSRALLQEKNCLNPSARNRSWAALLGTGPLSSLRPRHPVPCGSKPHC